MKRVANFAVPLILVVFASLLVSCGAVGSGNQFQVQSNARPAEQIRDEFLYAFSVGQIRSYQLAADGTLNLMNVQPNPVNLVGNILVTPNGRHLFGSTFTSLVTFAVQPNSGRLRQSFSTPLPPAENTNVFALTKALNPSGTLLAVSQETLHPSGAPTEQVTTYSVSPAGKLTRLKTTVLSGLSPFTGSPVDLTFDPAGKFLYAGLTADFSAEILQLAINVDGGVNVVDTFTSTLSSDWGLVFHPSGKYLYQGTGGPSVGAFSVTQSTGSLTQIQTAGCACDAGPDFGRGVVMSPLGTVLFQITGQDWGVALYTINQPTGELTPVPSSFILELSGVDGVAVDKTGRFLYVAGSESGAIEAFDVSASGQVTAIASTAIPSRLGALVIDPLTKP